MRHSAKPVTRPEGLAERNLIVAPQPDGPLADRPRQLPESSEVVLHELGESVAVTVASVQHELARYPNDLGAYILDEMELSVPVRMWVDNLGQVLVSVVANETPGASIGHLRLKVRPVLGASQLPPVTSGQPLAALGALTPEEIAQLEARRIFSVDDLLRIARHAAGHAGLWKLGLSAGLTDVLDRAAVLSLPMLPSPVAESLLRIGIKSPADFVRRNAEELAGLLSEQLEQSICPEDVEAWQQRVRDFIALPLPGRCD